MCVLLLCLTAKAQPNLSDPPPDKFIGIQIGASGARVGVMQNGTLQVFTNSQGSRSTPSYVVYTDEGFLVGEAAQKHPAPNLFEAVIDMNHLFSQPNTTVKDESPDNITISSAYTIACHPSKPRIHLTTNGTTHTFKPEEIYAPLLAEMRKIAESHLDVNVTGAVVVIPASYYDDEDKSREMIRRAGKLIGLPIQREIRESTAVGLAYGLDKVYGEMDVVVYDLGSRYLDVSIMEVDDGIFELIASVREMIGGEDFDRRVVDYFVGVCREKYGVDISEDLKAMEKLAKEAEKAKRALSSETSYQIEIEGFHNDLKFSEVLTRGTFEELNMELFESTLSYTDQALRESQRTKTDMRYVMLGGGSTEIPMLQEMLANHFSGLEVTKMEKTEEAALFGAAQQAHALDSDDWVCCGCYDEEYGMMFV